MKKLYVGLVWSVVGLILSPVDLGAVDSTWTNTAMDGNWYNSTNWSPSVVPGAPGNADIPAVFPTPVPFTLPNIFFNTSVTLNTLTFHDSYTIVEIDQSTLTLGGGTITPSTLAIDAAQALSLQVPLIISTGTTANFALTDDAGIIIQSITANNATINITNPTPSANSEFIYFPSVTETSFSLSGNTTFNSQVGTLQFFGSGTSGSIDTNSTLVYDNIFDINAGMLQNNGSLSGPLGTSVFTLENQATLINQGTFITQTGIVNVTNSTLTNSGTMTMFLPLGGAGTVNVTNSTLTNSGTIQVDTLNFNSGTLTNNGNGNIAVFTSATINGSIVLNGTNSSASQVSFQGSATVVNQSASITIDINYASPTQSPCIAFLGGSQDNTMTYCACSPMYVYGVLPINPVPVTIQVPATYTGPANMHIPIIYVQYGVNNNEQNSCSSTCGDNAFCIIYPLVDAFTFTHSSDANARYHVSNIYSEPNTYDSSSCDYQNVYIDIARKPNASPTAIGNQGMNAKTSRVQVRQSKTHNTMELKDFLAAGPLSDDASRYVAQNELLSLEGVVCQQRISEQLEERSISAPDIPWSVYLGPISLIGRFNQQGTHEGCHYHTIGGLVGFDYAWSNVYSSIPCAVGLGMTVEYNQLNGTIDGHAGRFASHQAYGIVYGTLVPKKVKQLALNAIVGGGYDWYNLERNALPGVVAKGNPTGPQANALLGMEYSFSHTKYVAIPENLRVVPILTVQYAYSSVGSYTEHGAGVHDLKVSSQQASSLWTSLETRINYEFGAKDKIQTRPEMRLGWQYEYLGMTHRSTATTFAAVPSPFISQVAPPARSSLVVGANIAIDFYRKAMVQFDYDFWYNNDFTLNSFFLEIKGMF